MTHIENNYTEEGEQMWKNINDYELPPISNKKPIVKIDYYQEEVHRLRNCIKKLIINSENVIKETEEIISLYKDKQEYISSEAKVYKTSHERLITRLNKILNGQEPFNFEIVIEKAPVPQTESVLYYNPSKR